MGKLDETGAAMRSEEELSEEELAELFADEDEDLDIDRGDENAHDAEILDETRTAPPIANAPAPRGLIHGEVVSDEFSDFLDSLPNDQITTIVVRRLEDRNYSGQFRLPCDVSGHVDTVYWKHPKTAEEIYSEIQHRHGGGIYQFQVRQGSGFAKGKTWSQIIRDPAKPSQAELARKAEKDETAAAKANEVEQQRSQSLPAFSQNNPAPAEPPDEEELIDKFMERMERWQNFFTKMQPPPPPEVQQYSVKDQIILEAMRKAPNGDELNAQVVKKAMALVTEEKKNWVDLAMYAAEHSDKIMKTVGTVIGTLGPVLFGGTRQPVPPRPSMNMPMPSGTLTPIQTPPAAAPTGGLQMPPVQRQEDVPAAPSPETQPAATERPAIALKTVEW
jgi:hypothetical protein